jgi:hypothetical protein
MDPEVHGVLYRMAPHVASDFIRSALDVQTSRTKLQEGQLAFAQKLVENGMRGLALVSDEPSYQAWRFSMATQVPAQAMVNIPATYSPEAVAKLQQSGQAAATQFSQRIEQAKLDNETKNADTQRFLAETGQKAEARQGREFEYHQTPAGIIGVPKYPQAGTPPAGGLASPQPIPGSAPAMAPGAAAAAGSEQQARAAHDVLKTIEASNANLTGILRHGVDALPGVGASFTPAANLRSQQAQKQFMTAIGGGDPSQYFVQPGDIGLFKGPSDPAYQQLLAQKQAAREAAIQKLRIQTNRPQGLTPPGQTSVTPGSTAPHTPQVYTRAQVSALATRHKMSEASIEALIKADGDRVAP